MIRDILLVASVAVMTLVLSTVTVIYLSIWRTGDAPVDNRRRRRSSTPGYPSHDPTSSVDLLVHGGADLRTPEAALQAIQEILRHPTGWTRIDVSVQRILDEHYRQHAAEIASNQPTRGRATC